MTRARGRATCGRSPGAPPSLELSTGGAGGSASSSAGGSGGGGAGEGGTGGSAECADLNVIVSGSVKVKLEALDADFEAGVPGPVCVPLGSVTLIAECDQGGGSDPPTDVSWGNALCPNVGSTCMFTPVARPNASPRKCGKLPVEGVP